MRVVQHAIHWISMQIEQIDPARYARLWWKWTDFKIRIGPRIVAYAESLKQVLHRTLRHKWLPAGIGASFVGIWGFLALLPIMQYSGAPTHQPHYSTPREYPDSSRPGTSRVGDPPPVQTVFNTSPSAVPTAETPSPLVSVVPSESSPSSSPSPRSGEPSTPTIPPPETSEPTASAVPEVTSLHTPPATTTP